MGLGGGSPPLGLGGYKGHQLARFLWAARTLGLQAPTDGLLLVPLLRDR